MPLRNNLRTHRADTVQDARRGGEKAEELKESWNAPAVIQVEEGTEADYEAHFGEGD